MKTVYLICTWDSMASSWGDWADECVCLTAEAAEEEKERLTKAGHKVIIVSLPLRGTGE